MRIPPSFLRSTFHVLCSSQSGQVMLMVVLVLTGTVLTATTIGGVLISRSIRDSRSASDSMRAIYAADTGVEWELYKAAKDPVAPAPTLQNGTSFQTSQIAPQRIKSLGQAGSSARAFEIQF